MNLNLKHSCAIIFSTAFLSTSAFGITPVITTYTTAAAWDAAVSNKYVTETFDATGLKSFTGVATTNGVIGPARGVLTGSVWTDQVVPGAASTTFSYLPGLISGAGGVFDTSPNGEGSGLLILDLNSGGNQTVAQIGPIAGTFFGWTSNVPFQSFQISGGTNGGIETYDLDNLQFANSVPEPASLGIIGLVAVVGRLGRRSRKPLA